jgi:hypothetical protein
MLHLLFTWLPTGSSFNRLSEKIIIAVVIGKQATQKKMNGSINLSIESINYLAANVAIISGQGGQTFVKAN